MQTATRLNIFDWNGALLTDLKADEATFGIAVTHLSGQGVMGFEAFDVSGDPANIQAFINYYELDPEEA